MVLFLVSVFTSYFSVVDIFRSDFKEKREITLLSEKKKKLLDSFIWSILLSVGTA